MAPNSSSLIDTRIYGNPDDIRDAAAKVRKIYEALNDAYIEMSNSLVPLPNTGEARALTHMRNFLMPFVHALEKTLAMHTTSGRQCEHTHNSLIITTAIWKPFDIMR